MYLWPVNKSEIKGRSNKCNRLSGLINPEKITTNKKSIKNKNAKTILL